MSANPQGIKHNWRQIEKITSIKKKQLRRLWKYEILEEILERKSLKKWE